MSRHSTRLRLRRRPRRSGGAHRSRESGRVGQRDRRRGASPPSATASGRAPARSRSRRRARRDAGRRPRAAADMLPGHRRHGRARCDAAPERAEAARGLADVVQQARPRPSVSVARRSTAGSRRASRPIRPDPRDICVHTSNSASVSFAAHRSDATVVGLRGARASRRTGARGAALRSRRHDAGQLGHGPNQSPCQLSAADEVEQPVEERVEQAIRASR